MDQKLLCMRCGVEITADNSGTILIRTNQEVAGACVKCRDEHTFEVQDILLRIVREDASTHLED